MQRRRKTSAVRKYARALSVTLEAIERSKMAASALIVPPMAWPAKDKKKVMILYNKYYDWFNIL